MDLAVMTRNFSTDVSKVCVLMGSRNDLSSSLRKHSYLCSLKEVIILVNSQCSWDVSKGFRNAHMKQLGQDI